MAGSSKLNRLTSSLAFILTAALFGGWAFSVPADASLHRALDLLKHAQAENSKAISKATSDPAVSELLNSALALIETKPSSEYSHGDTTKTEIVTAVQAALSNLQLKDMGKAAQDIAQAIAAMKEDMWPGSQYAYHPPSPAQPSVPGPSASPAAGSPFSGTVWKSIKGDGGATSTITFEADGQWTEIWRSQHWTGTWYARDNNTKVTVMRSDHRLDFRLTPDDHLVRTLGQIVYQRSSSLAGTNAATNDFGTVAPPPAVVEHAALTVKLTEDQARAVVLIKGDNAEGTGFLVKTADGPAVVTNIHVISNNPNLKITTNTGAQIAILSYKGATDRDMVMISIADGNYSYLELAKDVSATVQPGDEVITPGNSEGGEVMLNTDGKVLGIGPERVEFDNPVYHGNSGGPVFHVKSGKVIGVVTEAIKVDVSNELDKASFANRNSAIGHSMRYFGLRVDSVPKWETYEPRRFLNETAFLEQFEQRSEALDCYLNSPNDNKPEDTVWEKDAKIVQANGNCLDLAAGADSSQQLDAVRALYGELGDVAHMDMDAIGNSNNFYSFDQQRAKDDIAYRNALKAELDSIGNDVSRMGSIARRN